jgi:cell division protein FtsQ
LFNRMKRVANILKWAALVLYFPVMLAFVSVSNRSVVCADVRVVVKDSLTAGFVVAGEVRKNVLEKYPDILGAPLSDIDFHEVEAFIRKHSAIRTAQVYNSASGVVNVVVTQHQPVVRVFSNEGTYYLDGEGRQIPVHKRFAARVLVANGLIPADKSDLVHVAAYIAKDPFWEAQMEQIYIRRNGDYVLVPRVGDHLILLGKPEGVEDKLRNLKALYERGLDAKEWNEFKVINLKFNGQVICSRKREF